MQIIGKNKKRGGDKNPKVGKNGYPIEIDISLYFISPKLYKHPLFWKKTGLGCQVSLMLTVLTSMIQQLLITPKYPRHGREHRQTIVLTLGSTWPSIHSFTRRNTWVNLDFFMLEKERTLDATGAITMLLPGVAVTHLGEDSILGV